MRQAACSEALRLNSITPWKNCLFHSDPDRACLIVRYIFADMVPFPLAMKEQLPEVFRVPDTLAQKAGCPFEWALLLFLPVLGTAYACLFIN